MYIVAAAWLYVVLMMAVAEATSSQGSVLGAVFTLLLYGLMPLSIVMYILGTPARKRARRAAAAAAALGPSTAPDAGGQAAGEAVAPEREKG